jgi:ribosome-binding protein aMBF1 (putative translation factor)
VIQLQKSREALGISQSKLAREIDGTANTVYLWEGQRKIKRPYKRYSKALEDFFGLTVDQLFAPVNENSLDAVSVEAA